MTNRPQVNKYRTPTLHSDGTVSYFDRCWQRRKIANISATAIDSMSANFRHKLNRGPVSRPSYLGSRGAE